MKLLIITQKVNKNDSYFGFFHGWLQEFARQCDMVTVIGLEVGAYDLPENVKVLSLGKETKRSKFQYIWRLISYSWKERSRYDYVFVHMNPPYLITTGWLWKFLGKKTGLWYVHRHVDLKLRIAHMFADMVFTATSESFQIKSRKVHLMGQAVPLDTYRRPSDFQRESKKNDVLEIISVGRITPIKNLETLIHAVAILRDRGIAVRAKLIGEPVKEGDFAYKDRLLEQIRTEKVDHEVIFTGSVANIDIPKCYWQSDLSVNLCPTGGLDKAVLESMAAGTPVMVSNEAFRDFFGPYADRMIFIERDADMLARKIGDFIKASDKQAIVSYLSVQVEKRSSLRSLISNIVGILAGNQRT